MKFSTTLPFLASGLILGTPVLSTIARREGPANPCAQLAALALAQEARAKNATLSFSPSMVLECLQNVPINITAAADQISWFQNFLQFQTTLSYLKNPTPYYQLPAIDLIGGLDSIKHKVIEGEYANEFDFELAVHDLVVHADDGHLTYTPFTLRAFGFARPVVELVSISRDGIEMPKTYLVNDIRSVLNHTSPSKISAVSTVDSEPIEVALTNIGYLGQSQDLDAQYNQQLFNPASALVISGNSNADIFVQPGPSIVKKDHTKVTFENGTSREFPNKAVLDPSLELDFQSGNEFSKKYLTPQPQQNASTVPPQAAPVTNFKFPTEYPRPINQHRGGFVAGFFIKDVSNTAVLSIPSFNAEDAHSLKEFQLVVQDFLKTCRSTSKTKLIIDIRGNGGGKPVLAYDTFKQLFPDIKPYSGLRARSSPAMNALGRIVSDLSATYPTAGGLILDAPSFKTPSGSSFSSWDELAGPVENHGDRFTRLASWDLSNSSATPVFSGNLTVSGYESRSSMPPQPFSSDDITLLSDGNCASTCGLFANLLIRQGKVRTIFAGGRPTTSPVAMIGGTQGGAVLPYSQLQAIATVVLEAGNSDTTLSTKEKEEYAKAILPLTLPAPINLFPSADNPSINLLDNIAEGDETGTPLQFAKPLLADCRIFYVARDISDVESTWERIASGVERNGEGFCVGGKVGKWGSVAEEIRKGMNRGGRGYSNGTDGASGTAAVGGASPVTAGALASASASVSAGAGDNGGNGGRQTGSSDFKGDAERMRGGAGALLGFILLGVQAALYVLV